MAPDASDHDNDPAVFFTGAYRYRRGGVLVTALACIGFGAVLGYKTLTVPAMRGGAGAVVFGAFACASLLLGAHLVHLWAARRELVLRVTHDGVAYGDAAWAWPRIARVGGVTDEGGVALTVLPRGATLTRTLATTPPLDREQFARLLGTIQAHVARRHPHVHVDPDPHVVRGG